MGPYPRSNVRWGTCSTRQEPQERWWAVRGKVHRSVSSLHQPDEDSHVTSLLIYLLYAGKRLFRMILKASDLLRGNFSNSANVDDHTVIHYGHSFICTCQLFWYSCCSGYVSNPVVWAQSNSLAPKINLEVLKRKLK